MGGILFSSKILWSTNDFKRWVQRIYFTPKQIKINPKSSINDTFNISICKTKQGYGGRRHWRERGEAKHPSPDGNLTTNLWSRIFLMWLLVYMSNDKYKNDSQNASTLVFFCIKYRKDLKNADQSVVDAPGLGALATAHMAFLRDEGTVVDAPTLGTGK